MRNTVVDMVEKDLTESILGSCFEVMNIMGSGFLESVYKNSLAISLDKKGIRVREEASFELFFLEKKVGHYIADLLVEDKVIVELKCCKILLPEHHAQVINYLRAAKLSVGLLVNFGCPKLEYKRLWS